MDGYRVEWFRFPPLDGLSQIPRLVNPRTYTTILFFFDNQCKVPASFSRVPHQGERPPPGFCSRPPALCEVPGYLGVSTAGLAASPYIMRLVNDEAVTYRISAVD
jgi:hypothetical protein